MGTIPLFSVSVKTEVLQCLAFIEHTHNKCQPLFCVLDWLELLREKEELKAMPGFSPDLLAG